MDYTPPTLCIRSIEPAETPGRFYIDMPSLWTDDGPLNVDKQVIDNITTGRYAVPMCPPGYPNPPLNNNKRIR